MTSAAAFWNRYAALGYDALSALLPYDALLDDLLATAQLIAGERVFVAGCGTGMFEARAIRRQPDLQIDALDFSEQMLVRARAKCSDFPQVRHQQGDLRRPLPYPAASIDCAVMCNVLYALPDRPAALRAISQVVRPGGRFILCDRPPGSDPKLVTRAHFQMLQALPGAQRATGWLQTLAALPPLLAVAAVNGQIQERMRTGEYYFYPVEEISALLSTLGFHVRSIEPAYAEQCWLLCAERTTEEI